MIDSKEESAQALPSPSKRIKPGRKPLVIKAIIVEDDPMVTRNKQALPSEFQDIEVGGIFQTEGTRAFTFVLENEIDLIILDITMPVLTA